MFASGPAAAREEADAAKDVDGDEVFLAEEKSLGVEEIHAAPLLQVVAGCSFENLCCSARNCMASGRKKSQAVSQGAL